MVIIYSFILGKGVACDVLQEKKAEKFGNLDRSLCLLLHGFRRASIVTSLKILHLCRLSLTRTAALWTLAVTWHTKSTCRYTVKVGAKCLHGREALRISFGKLNWTWWNAHSPITNRRRRQAPTAVYHHWFVGCFIALRCLMLTMSV